jgi:hypothetical protein
MRTTIREQSWQLAEDTKQDKKNQRFNNKGVLQDKGSHIARANATIWCKDIKP